MHIITSTCLTDYNEICEKCIPAKVLEARVDDKDAQSEQRLASLETKDPSLSKQMIRRMPITLHFRPSYLLYKLMLINILIVSLNLDQKALRLTSLGHGRSASNNIARSLTNKTSRWNGKIMRSIDSKYIKRKEYVKDRIEIEKQNALVFSFPEKRRDFERRQRKLHRRAENLCLSDLGTSPPATYHEGNGTNEVGNDIAAQILSEGGFFAEFNTPLRTMEAFSHRQSWPDLLTEESSTSHVSTGPNSFKSYGRFDAFYSQHDHAGDYLELIGKDNLSSGTTQ